MQGGSSGAVDDADVTAEIDVEACAYASADADAAVDVDVTADSRTWCCFTTPVQSVRLGLVVIVVLKNSC